jgi:hypothetical protein
MPILRIMGLAVWRSGRGRGGGNVANATRQHGTNATTSAINPGVLELNGKKRAG